MIDWTWPDDAQACYSPVTITLEAFTAKYDVLADELGRILAASDRLRAKQVAGRLVNEINELDAQEEELRKRMGRLWNENQVVIRSDGAFVALTCALNGCSHPEHA